MVQLIFFIIYIIKRPKVVRTTADMFPEVNREEFDKWKSLEMKSIDVFLWGSGICTVLSFATAPLGEIGLQIAWLGLTFIVLIYSAILGSKAESMRKQLGINLNRK